MYQLFEGLMADLLIKKPNDPIAHMIASLKQPPRPRVFVFGPPGADTQSQCELISSKLGLVHVVPKAVWREAAKGGSEAGASAKALEDEGKEVPLELKVSMLVEKLESAECKANGWVLDGDEKCSPGEWSTSVDHEAPPPSFGEARPGIGEPSRLNCATCAPSECGLSILKPKT